jgi:hypothetical protein
MLGMCTAFPSQAAAKYWSARRCRCYSLLQTFHGTDLTQTTYQIEKTLRGVSVDGQVYEGRAKLLMPTPRSKPELQGIQYRSLQAGQKSGPENKQGSGCQHL